MKVLITGGAGYIGTELAYKLAADEAIEKIIIYDNLSRPNYNAFIGVSKFPSQMMEFIEGDLLDSRKLRKIMAGVDVLYHLAAKVTTPFADQNPHLFEQVNHWGTAEVVYAAEEIGVEKFIYLSSVSVYGAGDRDIDINTVPNPRTFYGISKLRGEEHVQRLMKKTNTWIIRCGNVYGYSKSMRFDAVINKFMFDANFHGRVSVHGDGRQNRAFIHVRQATHALYNLLNADLKPDCYNLVQRNLSIQKIIEHLKDVYPEMEMLFINQHLKLRTINVKSDERMAPLMDKNDKTIYFFIIQELFLIIIGSSFGFVTAYNIICKEKQ